MLSVCHPCVNPLTVIDWHTEIKSAEENLTSPEIMEQASIVIQFIISEIGKNARKIFLSIYELE